jgi:hypothetical protein
VSSVATQSFTCVLAISETVYAGLSGGERVAKTQWTAVEFLSGNFLLPISIFF